MPDDVIPDPDYLRDIIEGNKPLADGGFLWRGRPLMSSSSEEELLAYMEEILERAQETLCS